MIFSLAFLSSLIADLITKKLFPVMVMNKGVAFGWWPASSWLLPVGMVIISLAVFFWWRKNKQVLPAWLVGVFLGAASGNIFDRIMFGAVRDIWCWPGGICNNFADIVINLSLLTALLLLFRKKHFH